MHSLLITFFASTCTSLSSFIFRKNSEYSSPNKDPNVYLLCYFFASFALSIIFFPSVWSSQINLIILGMGAFVGTLNVFLMLVTAKALKEGPAGLTFAFQNASAIFPGMLLYAIFGLSYGFNFSYFQLVGIAFLTLGLFIGTKSESKARDSISLKWLIYALSCFLMQVIALTLIQGRCIIFDCDLKVPHNADIWFMPGQFGAALILQAFITFYKYDSVERREVYLGFCGGLANFSSTLLLLLATKMALPFEKTILFPCFAASTIILCNTWANRVYKEVFNLKANALCALGIIFGVMT